jgi:hypothetical protein
MVVGTLAIHVLAVQLSPISFGLAAVGLTGLLIVVAALHRTPSRPCHRCGRRVPISARVCRYCGYEFSPVRMSR